MKRQKKTQEPKIRKVVLMGDFHFGSACSIVEPGFRNHDGIELKAGPFGEWLWECWNQAQDWIAQKTAGEPYALVLMGDIIEGNHHRNMQVISPEIEDHIGLAVSMLTPVARRATKTYLIQGTECHTNGHENGIGREIGAERNEITGGYSFVRLERTIAGTKSVFRHHIGTTSRSSLEASQLGIHLAEEQLIAAKAGLDIPKVLVCAHRHKYGSFRDNVGMTVVTPPWQMATRFAHKVVPNPIVAPGVVFLDYREDGKIPEMDEIHFRSPIQECKEI